LRHRSFARALAALALAAAVTLGSLPSAALAVDPPRPLPGYVPSFVTEREAGAWEDCIWAAAEMLLDKWTSGVTRVDRRQLRKLSGDTEGGSSLADVTKAYSRLGFALAWSPIGGDNVTWPELLKRLEQGGGAILLGDYGKLPSRLGRWNRTFWARTGAEDDHALYLDRYDRKRGRIFVMDPLAPRDWTGEWVSVAALKRYAWRNHAGRLWVAMTPAASLAPVRGVELGEPVVLADSDSLDVSWSIDRTPTGWAYAGSSVSAEMTPIGEVNPLESFVVASSVAGSPLLTQAARSDAEGLDGAAAAGPTSSVADGLLRAIMPLPTAPGVYRVTIRVIDRRLGGEFASAGPFNLYVPGPRAANFIMPGGSQSAEPGTLLAVSFAVLNVGSASWLDTPRMADLPLDVMAHRATRLVARWVAEPPDPLESEGLAIAAPPEPIDLGLLPLDVGFGQLVDAAVRVPAQPGTWRLVIDLVDDIDGSFALSGSAPGIVDVDVFAPRLVPGAH